MVFRKAKTGSDKANEPGAGGSVHRILLVFILVAVSISFTLFAKYDGRLFQDHDMAQVVEPFALSRSKLPDTTSFVQDLRKVYFSCRQNTYITVNVILVGIEHGWGINVFAFRMINLPFYLALILGAYFLGRIGRSKTTGLLAAFVIATLPFFHIYARKMFPQFHLTCILIWAHVFVLLFLEKKEEASWSVFLGLGATTGGTILTHLIGLIKSVPIFCALVFFCWIDLRFRNAKLRTKSVVAMLIAVVVSLPATLFVFAYAGAGRIGLLMLSKEQFANALGKIKAAGWMFFEGFDWMYFAAFAASLPLAIVSSYRRNRKNPSTQYLWLTCLYYLFCYFYLNATGCVSSDVMILFALLPITLIREAEPFFCSISSPGARRVAVCFCVVVLVAIGVVEKSKGLSPLPESYLNGTSFVPHHRTFRYLMGEKDIYYRIFEAMRQRATGKELTLAFSNLPDPPPGIRSNLGGDFENRLLDEMKRISILNGFRLEHPRNNPTCPDRFEIGYYVSPLPIAQQEQDRILLMDQKLGDAIVGQSRYWTYTQGALRAGGPMRSLTSIERIHSPNVFVIVKKTETTSL